MRDYRRENSLLRADLGVVLRSDLLVPLGVQLLLEEVVGYIQLEDVRGLNDAVLDVLFEAQLVEERLELLRLEQAVHVIVHEQEGVLDVVVLVEVDEDVEDPLHEPDRVPEAGHMADDGLEQRQVNGVYVYLHLPGHFLDLVYHVERGVDGVRLPSEHLEVGDGELDVLAAGRATHCMKWKQRTYDPISALRPQNANV